MAFAGTVRPAARWCHASTELDEFAIVSYRVEVERLRAVLPAAVEPDVFTFADGAGGALVSAVPFLDRDFHFRCVPLVKVSCGQVNYRAYVRFRPTGERGVWFFGTSLDSVFVALPQLAWKMPWHRDRIVIEAAWEGSACPSWDFLASGWGAASCRLHADGQPMSCLDGFADLDECTEVLTHPMVGWYQRRGGGIGRYSVWHEVLALQACAVDQARFAVFEELDLVEAGATPHSALLQRTVHFDVHTPPRKVRERPPEPLS